MYGILASVADNSDSRHRGREGRRRKAPDSPPPPLEALDRLAWSTRSSAHGAEGGDRRFAEVLLAAAHLQEVLPDAVLVGGSAAAYHVEHRVSFDDDHVLADLRERFDDILEALEATDGWMTARSQAPVMILGSLDGVDTGVRQLIRRTPLEVTDVDIDGHRLRVPTLEETLRVKMWLTLRRNATRDYLDFAALADRLGLGSAATQVLALDQFYADQRGPGGDRVSAQVMRQLAEPAPYDLDRVDLREYRRLAPRWQSWTAVAETCQAVAQEALGQLGGES
jgi:hypothetical protein